MDVLQQLPGMRNQEGLSFHAGCAASLGADTWIEKKRQMLIPTFLHLADSHAGTESSLSNLTSHPLLAC